MNVIPSNGNEAFRAFAASFRGETVTFSWFSDYAVLYLEIGRAIEQRASGRPKGEKSIFVGYAWTGVRPDGSAFDRLEEGINNELLKRLPGQRIDDLEMVENDELRITFDSGLYLTSRRLDLDEEDPAPDWHLFNVEREPNAYFSLDG